MTGAKFFLMFAGTVTVMSVAGGVSFVLFSFALETFAAGMLLPMFLIPAVLAWLICESVIRWQKWAGVSYLLLIIMWLAYCGLVAIFGGSEGKRIVLLFGLSSIPTSVAGYVCLRKFMQYIPASVGANLPATRRREPTSPEP